MKSNSRGVFIMVLTSFACASAIFYFIFLDSKPNLLIIVPILFFTIASGYFWARYFLKNNGRWE